MAGNWCACAIQLEPLHVNAYLMAQVSWRKTRDDHMAAAGWRCGVMTTENFGS
jgi:hypothetical protein